MSDIELPPLPEPLGGATYPEGDYSADQMRAYARAAVDSALEAAAVKIDALMHKDIKSASSEWRKARYEGLYESAYAIRSMRSIADER